MTLARDDAALTPVPLAAEPASAGDYHDPAQWQVERVGVFARTWQFLGHESALPEPGCWIADVIAGYPVVVVRDEAGALNGFHNVCRHRAGPLTDGAAGRCE